MTRRKKLKWDQPYWPSYDTDLRRTFARVRRQQADSAKQPNVKTLKKRRA